MEKYNNTGLNDLQSLSFGGTVYEWNGQDYKVLDFYIFRKELMIKMETTELMK